MKRVKMFQLEKVANTIFRWFLLPLVCAASHHHTFRPGTARLLSRAGAGDSQIAVCSQLSHRDRVSNAASAISSAKKKKACLQTPLHSCRGRKSRWLEKCGSEWKNLTDFRVIQFRTRQHRGIGDKQVVPAPFRANLMHVEKSHFCWKLGCASCLSTTFALL